MLEEDDLGVAYACLKAYSDEGEELFCFFNSGEHSGASQPHRHMQFLPVASMRSGITTEQWQPLIDGLIEELPFTCFATSISAASSPTVIHQTYLTLHSQAVELAKVTGLPLVDSKQESLVSYNLAITTNAMVLCPRTAEGAKIEWENDEMIGPIAVNGTLLAGTVLVKNKAEWNAIRLNASKLYSVFQAIGIPPSGV